MLKQRLEWYKRKQVDVQDRIEIEREKIPMDKKEAKHELIPIKEEKRAVLEKRRGVRVEVANLNERVEEKNIILQVVVDRVEELRRRKAELLNERKRKFEVDLLERI